MSASADSVVRNPQWDVKKVGSTELNETRFSEGLAEVLMEMFGEMGRQEPREVADIKDEG